MGKWKYNEFALSELRCDVCGNIIPKGTDYFLLETIPVEIKRKCTEIKENRNYKSVLDDDKMKLSPSITLIACSLKCRNFIMENKKDKGRKKFNKVKESKLREIKNIEKKYNLSKDNKRDEQIDR